MQLNGHHDVAPFLIEHQPWAYSSNTTTLPAQIFWLEHSNNFWIAL
jgi:hypothetical protein